MQAQQIGRVDRWPQLGPVLQRVGAAAFLLDADRLAQHPARRAGPQGQDQARLDQQALAETLTAIRSARSARDARTAR